jgi:hypothetical protein
VQLYQFYAAPIKRDRRHLSVNPGAGGNVLARTPREAQKLLQLPEIGHLFAVWLLTPDVCEEDAVRICAATPPHRVYMSLGDGVTCRLAVDPAYDVTVEGPDADGN